MGDRARFWVFGGYVCGDGWTWACLWRVGVEGARDSDPIVECPAAWTMNRALVWMGSPPKLKSSMILQLGGTHAASPFIIAWALGGWLAGGPVH